MNREQRQPDKSTSLQRKLTHMGLLAAIAFLLQLWIPHGASNLYAAREQNTTSEREQSRDITHKSEATQSRGLTSQSNRRDADGIVEALDGVRVGFMVNRDFISLDCCLWELVVESHLFVDDRGDPLIPRVLIDGRFIEFSLWDQEGTWIAFEFIIDGTEGLLAGATTSENEKIAPPKAAQLLQGLRLRLRQYENEKTNAEKGDIWGKAETLARRMVAHEMSCEQEYMELATGPYGVPFNATEEQVRVWAAERGIEIITEPVERENVFGEIKFVQDGEHISIAHDFCKKVGCLNFSPSADMTKNGIELITVFFYQKECSDALSYACWLWYLSEHEVKCRKRLRRLGGLLADKYGDATFRPLKANAPGSLGEIHALTGLDISDGCFWKRNVILTGSVWRTPRGQLVPFSGTSFFLIYYHPELGQEVIRAYREALSECRQTYVAQEEATMKQLQENL